MSESLPKYLHRIFCRLNVSADGRNFDHWASLEEFKFSAFSDAVERMIIGHSRHKRITTIAVLARRAVELAGRALKTYQDPGQFLAVVDELNVILEGDQKIPTESIEILDHNMTTRRQWTTHGAWIPAGHVLAIIPPHLLSMDLLEKMNGWQQP